MPVIMPGMPVIDRNKIPAKKVARIGPENAEPIIFTISITVDEDFATKYAPPALRIPHNKVLLSLGYAKHLEGFLCHIRSEFQDKI